MKIVMLIEAGLKLAKRFGIGVSDIKHLHKAFKKNKLEENDTPAGQYDYARLTGFITLAVALVSGIFYAFGKIDEEVYNKLLDVLNNI